MPLFLHLPRTMGHENAGVITEVGEGMDQWKVGDGVGLVPVMSDGYGKWDGGFGPRLLATADNLVKLPDEVTFDLIVDYAGFGTTTAAAIETLYELIMSGRLYPPMNRRSEPFTLSRHVPVAGCSSPESKLNVSPKTTYTF